MPRRDHTPGCGWVCTRGGLECPDGRCLPRTRGGLPSDKRMRCFTRGQSQELFAPHTRGSTPTALTVCPAHAGVYPIPKRMLPGRCLPRTRGGLPNMPQPQRSGLLIAVCPAHAGVYRHVYHTKWACSVAVCPAHAGVYRRLDGRPGLFAHAGVYPIMFATELCLPRTRGGLPVSTRPLSSYVRFAPHTRGSTDLGTIAFRRVCPAHAGVYPF